jgi:phosphoglycolate phosphatase-like HAD superfamily hydrolase
MERRILLEQDPIAVGTAWARAVCDNLTGQGRSIAGGWPGTLVEARARIAKSLRDELTKHGFKELDPEELDHAVSATYARAKQEWFETERRADRVARFARRRGD